MVDVPAGEVCFLLRFQVDSIASYFPIHIVRELLGKKWYVTVHTGGRCSLVCFCLQMWLQ